MIPYGFGSDSNAFLHQIVLSQKFAHAREEADIFTKLSLRVDDKAEMVGIEANPAARKHTLCDALCITLGVVKQN